LDLLENVKKIINSGHLYYSTSYNLTHSLQHNYIAPSVPSKYAPQVDDRYFFNKHVSARLLAIKEATPWVTRIICGYAGAVDIDAPGQVVDVDSREMKDSVCTYTVALISRLNHQRLGTRYVRRGLDMDGNAANNVEMEQIVFNHDIENFEEISSFVQIRGSVPAIVSFFYIFPSCFYAMLIINFITKCQ
jgi:phosphatidylinositol 4-phosphatase